MTIGVVGCGNMGAALIQGMIEAGFVRPRSLRVWDPDTQKLRRLQKRLKINAVCCNEEVAASQVILLAVKPQQMREALSQMAPHLSHRPLIISIAAGVTTSWIERELGNKIPVVRVMPNTPALVKKGIAAVATGRHAGASHRKIAEKIFRSVGEVVHVPERLINAVTAISGSGPAYFFYLMEQMIEAGTRLGLPKSVAQQLVLATAQGAAHLARCDGQAPAKLRAKVTSKGGTTEAAFKFWSKKRLGAILQAGIYAAAKRAQKLEGK